MAHCKSYIGIYYCLPNRYERHLIETYFWEGFRYASIVRFLQEYHDIRMCVRTLRRRLRRYVPAVWMDLSEVIDSIRKQITCN